MSIANDAWIRKMALENGMIAPFEEKQVSKGKISFGVSSYGYDVRVGRHFKMFHNLNSTLVDPKKFDERSFIDHDGDECIIPPNSFVLAETVERFRIPRDVLAVCLGKCVTGDTRVVDATTGEWLPISEFAGRRRTLGLAGWATKELPVSDFIPQGRRPVFRLRTRMGLEIRATASHPFRQFTGWTALENLRPGDRIAAARKVPVFGKTPLPEGDAVRLAKSAKTSVPRAIFMAPGDAVATFLRTLFSGDGTIYRSRDGRCIFLQYTSMSRRFVEDVRHLLLRFGVVSLLRERTSRHGRTAHHLRIADSGMLGRLSEEIGIWRNDECVRLGPEFLPRRPARSRAMGTVDTPANEPWWSATQVATHSALAAVIGGEELTSLAIGGPAWDVVESIEPAGEEEVYDLTVPGAENFLANDLVVHNSTYARCGIIVNVTPLEPEWEGVITIEISNTTPLPAKIYANEGIAQILFFRAAPDGICETSYADRKGKYQSQTGLTLPKVS